MSVSPPGTLSRSISVSSSRRTVASSGPKRKDSRRTPTTSVTGRFMAASSRGRTLGPTRARRQVHALSASLHGKAFKHPEAESIFSDVADLSGPRHRGAPARQHLDPVAVAHPEESARRGRHADAIFAHVDRSPDERVLL